MHAAPMTDKEVDWAGQELSLTMTEEQAKGDFIFSIWNIDAETGANCVAQGCAPVSQITTCPQEKLLQVFDKDR